MAILQVDYFSKALYRTVTFQMILPSDKVSRETDDYPEAADKKYRTMYLLHGFMGNHTDWLTGTRIKRWAEEKELAVVMPAAENAFYVDSNVPFGNYGTFIGEELVEITRRMFPLSRKREDTYIAGLSMGGFGALRNGLKYSEVFSKVGVLSGALHIFEDDEPDRYDYYKVWGDMKAAARTDKNPKVALADMLSAGRQAPEIYLACGTEDFLIDINRKYRDLLVGAGLKVKYEETPGGHEWDFWDAQIKKVLDWLDA